MSGFKSIKNLKCINNHINTTNLDKIKESYTNYYSPNIKWLSEVLTSIF